MSDRLILAEGIQDLYFWGGLAEHFRWERDEGQKGNVRQHFYRSGELKLRIEDCRGKDSGAGEQGVMRMAGIRVNEWMANPVSGARYLINLDGDAAPTASDMDAKFSRFAEALGFDTTGAEPRQWRLQAKPVAGEPARDEELQLVAVIWTGREVEELREMSPSLERLVVGALATVTPEAWQKVLAFLSPGVELASHAPSPAHKSAVGLFRAGWFADQGDGLFLKQLWRIEPIAAALEDALRADGEWSRIERFFVP